MTGAKRVLGFIRIVRDPQQTVRRAKGKRPARAVIDPNRRLASPRRRSMNDGAPVLVVRRQARPMDTPKPARPIYVDADERGISCEAMVHAAVSHGVKRLLVEGGAIRCHGFSTKASPIGRMLSWRRLSGGGEC